MDLWLQYNPLAGLGVIPRNTAVWHCLDKSFPQDWLTGLYSAHCHSEVWAVQTTYCKEGQSGQHLHKPSLCTKVKELKDVSNWKCAQNRSHHSSAAWHSCLQCWAELNNWTWATVLEWGSREKGTMAVSGSGGSFWLKAAYTAQVEKEYLPALRLTASNGKCSTQSRSCQRYLWIKTWAVCQQGASLILAQAYGAQRAHISKRVMLADCLSGLHVLAQPTQCLLVAEHTTKVPLFPLPIPILPTPLEVASRGSTALIAHPALTIPGLQPRCGPPGLPQAKAPDLLLLWGPKTQPQSRVQPSWGPQHGGIAAHPQKVGAEKKRTCELR